MASRAPKLLAPIAFGLLVICGIAVYQVSCSKAHAPDTTQASMLTPADNPVITETKPAPDFELKGIDGKTYKLSDFRGKVVVLNFWATWCPPCRKEIPEYNELQAEYAAQGVQFIGIAVDEEGLDKVKPWVEKNTVGYPILIPDAKVVSSYGDLSAIPVTFFIDRKGMIRSSFVGMRQKPAVVDLIKPLVAEKS